jgi:hypothetical protein
MHQYTKSFCASLYWTPLHRHFHTQTIWDYSVGGIQSLSRTNYAIVHYRFLKLCSMTDFLTETFLPSWLCSMQNWWCKIHISISVLWQKLWMIILWNLWYRLKNSVLWRPQPNNGPKHHRIISRSIVYSCLPLFCRKGTNHCV